MTITETQNLDTMKNLNAVIRFAVVAWTLFSCFSCAFAASIDLAWTDNSNNEAAFLVERSEDGDAFAEIATLPPDSEAYTDAGLEPGSRYWYRVRAVNEFGFSGYTNVAEGLAKGPPPDPGPLETENTATLLIMVREDGTIEVLPANE